MKKLFFIIALCLVSSVALARDVKIYNSRYQYVGKIDSNTGKIYDSNYRRIGKIDTKTGKMYDSNYRRVGKIRFSK